MGWRIHHNPVEQRITAGMAKLNKHSGSFHDVLQKLVEGLFPDRCLINDRWSDRYSVKGLHSVLLRPAQRLNESETTKIKIGGKDLTSLIGTGKQANFSLNKKSIDVSL